MILQSQDQGFQFLCKYCHQYAKNPIVCYLCNTIYCFDCINQQPRQYKYNFKYPCSCTTKYSYTLNCVEQFVANQLSISCSICGQIKSIHKIKSHQVKCYLKEQEALNNSQFDIKFEIKSNGKQQLLICFYCKQTQFQELYRVNKYNQQIVCMKCIQLHFYSDQKYQINMSEESISNLQTMQLQCPFCLKNGNYSEILNHNFVCQQQIVDCQCGWSSRRSDFLHHFKMCSIQKLEKLYLELQQTEQLNLLIKFQYQRVKEEQINIQSKRSNMCWLFPYYYFNIPTIEISYEQDDYI